VHRPLHLRDQRVQLPLPLGLHVDLYHLDHGRQRPLVVVDRRGGELDVALLALRVEERRSIAVQREIGVVDPGDAVLHVGAFGRVDDLLRQQHGPASVVVPRRP
jgi:hypothetical protein